VSSGKDRAWKDNGVLRVKKKVPKERKEGVLDIELLLTGHSPARQKNGQPSA